MSGNSSTHWSEGLYKRKSAELILYGRALGLSHAEAEDVLQETFTALLRKLEPPLQPEHYCVRSFRNRSLNYRRSLWRRITRELEARSWFDRSGDESASERVAMRGLARLPVEQREVIVLKIWHHYTFEEIGALMGIPGNTAAGRYRYGIKKIKTLVEGEEHERDEFCGDSIAVLETAPPIGKH